MDIEIDDYKKCPFLSEDDLANEYCCVKDDYCDYLNACPLENEDITVRFTR